MLRSILLVLDDTPGAMAACDICFALARRTGAKVTAAAILDRPPPDASEAVPIGAAAYAERRNAALAEKAEAEARAVLEACRRKAGDLSFEVLRLEGAPEPALLRAGAQHDLIVLGRDSSLGQEEAEDGIAPAIEFLLQQGGRPLLVVPPGAPMGTEAPVLIGYDGSAPAMRALQLFALLGLAEGSRVKLLAAAEDRAEAARLAAEGAAFLRRHGKAVEEWPVTSDQPAELLLAEARNLKARLLVMGAFEHTGLRALFLGTSTRPLLRDAPCTVFALH